MRNYNQTLQTNNSSLEEIISKINELPDAGSADPVLQDKTVTPTTSQQTVVADSNYDGLGTVTVNAMPTATQATPIVSIDSNGTITATATQAAGYVSAGTQTSTKQLAFQPAKTIIPTIVDQIAVSSAYYAGGNITVAGDSNLIANNIKNGVSIFGVTGNYEGNGGAGSGSDTSVEDSLVTRTVSTYINDRVTNIGNYAFNDCSSLTSVSFPVCTSIGSDAFHGCNSLTSVSFPACTTIGNYAFYKCSSLTSVSFPACTTIGNYAFYKCSSLTSVSFPVCTTIGIYAFNECSSLKSVNFPVCTSIDNRAFASCSSLISVSFPACTTISIYAFDECSSLKSVNFPVCTTIDINAFASCSSLTSVNFPVCTSIDNYAFHGCNSLTSVSFPACRTIGNYAFYGCSSLTSVSFPACRTICSSAFDNCSSLTSIYLMASYLCTLSNSNAFSKTGIWSNKGSIFVPSSLVASYKKRTNWVFFSNRIFGI